MNIITNYLIFVASVFVLIITIRKILQAFIPKIAKNQYVSMLISATSIVAVMQFIISPLLQQDIDTTEIKNSKTDLKIKKVILAHAWPADSTTAWYPDLKGKLESKGIEVVIPTLPNPEESTSQDWVEKLKDVASIDTKHTLLIGHSIGGTALLRMLESTNNKYAGLIMVSTAGFDLGYPMLKDFFENEFNYDKIIDNTQFISTFYSPNDQVLAPEPVKHANVFLTNLDAKTIILNDRGHFAPFDNCTQVPELLEEIENKLER